MFRRLPQLGKTCFYRGPQHTDNSPKKTKGGRQMLDAAHGVAKGSIRDRKRPHNARTERKSTHASFACDMR